MASKLSIPIFGFESSYRINQTMHGVEEQGAHHADLPKRAYVTFGSTFDVSVELDIANDVHSVRIDMPSTELPVS